METNTNGSKGYAIASLVCGICSITICCCAGLIVIQGLPQLIVGIVGLVLGIIAKKKNYDGQSMALAGIILSSIGIVVGIVMFIIAILTIIGIANGSIDMSELESLLNELQNVN